MLAKTTKKKIDNNKKLKNDSPILDLNNSEIKSLIKKGKLNGFVTLDELNAALPPGEYSSEQIEDIHAAINEMGVNIVEQGDASTEETEDKDRNAGNLSDDEGARSDDPVRMYLKEMGSVELLSREGEISIAKRIEAGRELMIGGIYETPLAMRAFLKWRDDVDDGTMLLRDIIDLETTYARINGGANEPVISDKNEEPIKLTVDSSKASGNELKKSDEKINVGINLEDKDKDEEE
ncbi:MAG: RNA polymerase sigma factor region1.1 domain-containing protein, partial [Candidatus Puniceispirillales bacterium]